MPEWKARVRERLAGLDLDATTEAETIEELTQHVEDRYRDLIAAGAAEETAAAQTWRELEGHERLAREIAGARKVDHHDAVPSKRRAVASTALWDDFVFAWRRLRHAPGFALVSLLTVMLTVGANTAILSVADAVLFRPLPYAGFRQRRDHPDDQSRRRGSSRYSMPYPFLHAIDAACPSVSPVGLLEPVDSGTAWPRLRRSRPPTGQPPSVDGGHAELLSASRRPPCPRPLVQRRLTRVGRTSWPCCPTRPGSRSSAADESIVGRPITLGAATFDLVGVLPQASCSPPSLPAARRSS